MNIASALIREARFVSYDRVFLGWLLVVFLFAAAAIGSGLAETQHQNETIQHLVEADQRDRASEYSKQGDWGSAAYYSFHFTYDPPSDFAYAAMGQRDAVPWKHRLRMLALEGQIYEHDAGNPELALIGRFDFAFFVSFVVPLVLIFLLHDTQASERVAGRFDLLVATTGTDGFLWWTRVFLRSGGIIVATILPLIFAGSLNDTSFSTLISAIGYVIVYLVFWTIVCIWFSSWRRSAPVILSALIGVWVLLGTIVPAGGRVFIDRIVPVPSGSEILLTQREAVNDAWDLPVETTMTAFFERHAEWKGYTKTGDGFDWAWFYAFQQVGDQETERLSVAYSKGRRERDRLAGLLSLASPPALLERSLQRLAQTDSAASLVYETEVRQFHLALRKFYYPRLFREEPFNVETFTKLPQFSPAS
ncbi:MAG: DUF3526 domain-containing protein [Pseudomonadales bacterium]|nr:DUF3526 domain-containing protein [Pseudomonadales bacterium]MDG1443961.1 DUF3526 domain-containing protein [Pseudomonadales bacterium]